MIEFAYEHCNTKCKVSITFTCWFIGWDFSNRLCHKHTVCSRTDNYNPNVNFTHKQVRQTFKSKCFDYNSDDKVSVWTEMEFCK